MPTQAPNACCREDANLSESITPNAEKPEFTYRVCQVCRARHFTLKADPGVFGLTGNVLGRRIES